MRKTKKPHGCSCGGNGGASNPPHIYSSTSNKDGNESLGSNITNNYKKKKFKHLSGIVKNKKSMKGKKHK
jgi:hypothetical protein